MNHVRQFLSIIFCSFAVAVGLAGCTRNLSSDQYWNGATKEVRWVMKKLPGSMITQESQKEADSAYARPVTPFLKDGKSKFRIGIVISGDYWEFYDNLKALIEGFSSIGWAKRVTVPASLSTCGQLLTWLENQQFSSYVEFVPSYFVNLKWGDAAAEAELRRKYLTSRPDVDAVMAYGGMAARMFYSVEHYPTPVFADAITDSFGAGITQTLDDSGKDFFSGKIDPELYKQQVRLFAKVTGLKSIGIVYGDDEYGRIYGAVKDVEEIAAEEGFEIIRNTNVLEDTTDRTVDMYLKALKDVASRADAVYIGASTAVTEYDIMDRIVQILDEAKKPSFALEGSIRVKNGVLFSLSSGGMSGGGIFTAIKLTHAFNGVKPRSLPQKYEGSPTVALNLYTANKIGYKIPMDIMIGSNEVYIDRKGTKAQTADSLGSSASGITDFASVSTGASSRYMPHPRSGERKYRIGILQSGSYWEFTEHLRGILLGLQQSGWIDVNVSIPKKSESIEALLASLGTYYSDYLEFVPEYNAVLDWGESMKRAERFEKATRDDLDLVITFGAIAGQVFSHKKDYAVPVLVEAVNDPVAAGISYSQKDSGRNFLTCRIDPMQYQRQLDLFYNMIGFERLGIIYGDNEYGRIYGAVSDVEMVALRKGFSIVRNTNVKETVDRDTKKLYLAALEDVCSRADAVYLGASTAITEYDIMDEVVAILNKYRIPSFALEGDIRVKDGILMGVSSLETEKIGLYNADKIAAIFCGEAPRSLEQVFTGMPSITFNMKTAEAIRLDIPLQTLSYIDSLYW